MDRSLVKMSAAVVSPGTFVRLQSSQIKEHYTIRQKVHQGATSSLRRLTHKLTGADRILKTVHKRGLRTAGEHEQLLKQFNLLRSLDHPNILKMYEYFEDDKNYYFVAEYCVGGDLFSKITEQGLMTEAAAAEYLREILSVLTYLHGKGYMHKDLKPDSFMLDSTSDRAMLKLIDLSSAASIEPGAHLTEAFGTAYYIAPEVLDKPPRYDSKADIWSAYDACWGYCPYNVNRAPSGHGNTSAEGARR
jgi:calcium-dependent protein kinase